MSYIKAFTSEIQALVEIRHHNIVKLYGFCSHSQFLFLVYELSEKGSMNKILKDNEQAIAFDWNWRIKANKDFGTAKLVSPNSTNSTSFVGTFGYAAPG
ncbi:hypothetical protein JHK86_050908 [Glycine max]|nr:hypothetical protein JHK86_050908 [Glycine max]